jgi:L-iditol 2-dehydrogenase
MMGDTMRKVVLQEPYKITLKNAPVPKPKPGEVRVRVERIGVCGSDLTIYRGLHPYAKFPLVMGHEYSGRIDALGSGVKEPLPGTRVAVIPHLTCGHCEACKAERYNFCEELRCTGAEADGAHCDYICVPAHMALPIPGEMSMEDAALLEPACVAYHGAKRGDVQKGDRVLIVGAGPIGVFCLQSVKALGADKVYIADMDSSRLEIAKNLGADGTIDVSRKTVREGLEELCGGNMNIDLYYDCVGEKGRVLNDILLLAKRGSRIVIIGVLQNGYTIPNLPDFVQHELRLSGTTMYTPQDYRDMIAMISRGIVTTRGMVSHHFTLEEVPRILEMLDKRTENSFKIVINV